MGFSVRIRHQPRLPPAAFTAYCPLVRPSVRRPSAPSMRSVHCAPLPVPRLLMLRCPCAVWSGPQAYLPVKGRVCGVQAHTHGEGGGGGGQCIGHWKAVADANKERQTPPSGTSTKGGRDSAPPGGAPSVAAVPGPSPSHRHSWGSGVPQHALPLGPTRARSCFRGQTSGNTGSPGLHKPVVGHRSTMVATLPIRSGSLDNKPVLGQRGGGGHDSKQPPRRADHFESDITGRTVFRKILRPSRFAAPFSTPFEGVFAQRGHSARTVPIVTLLIPGTPLKTTPLQKRA